MHTKPHSYIMPPFHMTFPLNAQYSYENCIPKRGQQVVSLYTSKLMATKATIIHYTCHPKCTEPTYTPLASHTPLSRPTTGWQHTSLAPCIFIVTFSLDDCGFPLNWWLVSPPSLPLPQICHIPLEWLCMLCCILVTTLPHAAVIVDFKCTFTSATHKHMDHQSICLQ